MNKRMLMVLAIVAICLLLILLCRCWPSRKQVVDAVIDVYIKVFCEK